MDFPILAVLPTSETAEADAENSRLRPTTRIPKLSAKPKKGILKRSGSVNSPRALHDNEFLAGASTIDDQVLATPRGHRGAHRALSCTPSSAPSTSSVSKIPKLSVTWWETSSAYGDMTPSRNLRRAKSSTPPRYLGHDHDIDEEEYAQGDGEDAESVISCGASSIAGTWWFGRDTRFVPHCDKRHSHGGDFLAEQYLTPTQRKNREIADLKRQLKSALKNIEEKNERLRALEFFLSDEGAAISQNDDLMLPPQKISLADLERRSSKGAIGKIGDEMHSDELRPSIDYDAAINGSIGSAVLSAKDACFYADASTLTDSELFMTLISNQIQQELQAYKYECVVLRNRVSELEFVLKKFETTYDQVDSECKNPICEAKQRNMGAQIEAYKMECYTWRTKASETEIILKQERADKSILQSQIKNLEDHIKEMGADDQRGRLSPKVHPSSPDEPRFFARGIDDHRGSGPTADESELFDQLGSELDGVRKRSEQLNKDNDHLSRERDKLFDQLQQLSAENDEQSVKIASLSDHVDELRHALDETEDLLHSSELALQNVDQQLAGKRTELEVSQLTIHKLRGENEKLSSEKTILEEKLQTLESAMIESGVTIGGPSVRRRASRTPSAHQIVFRARDIQTDLNYREQLRIESDLKDISERYSLLKEQHDAQVSDLEDRISEISTNLVLKNNLVNTLTGQIQLLQDEIASLHNGMQRERQTFNQQVHELNLIAQRVPFLEKDVSTAREEMLALEQEYAKEKDRFEKVLESSMCDTLKSQQETSLYFRQRLEKAEKSAENFKQKLSSVQQELSDERMRTTLRRFELEQQLEVNLSEVERLQTKLFAGRHHVEIQAEPDTLDKAVLCYVRVFDKETEIPKDDLYDERTEQLKVLQGELQVTRRQVEVLQEKLVTASLVQQQLSEVEQQKQELMSRCSELQRDCEDLEAKRLIERNDFDSKYRSLVEENERMAEEEEQKYHALEAEFDNVRQEMDEVIKRYENKKAEMKARLESLEKENEDKLRLEDDFLCFKQNLELLEANFEREKMLLSEKERELEEIRAELKKAAEKTVPVIEKDESLSEATEFLRQFSQPSKIVENLRETDILGDSSDGAISEFSENVPIFVASKGICTPLTVSLLREKSLESSSGSGMITAAGSLQSCVTDIDRSNSNKDDTKPSSKTETFDSSSLSSSNAENRDVLVQSIQAQTHLLQNLRAELESEYKKHHNAKASLYERIQKLAKDHNNSSSSSYKSPSTANLKDDPFENCVGESIESLLPKIKSPTLRDTVIDMKAKLLYLVHENQELNSEMKDLKRSVYEFVSRREMGGFLEHKNGAQIEASEEEKTSKASDSQEVSNLRKDLEKIMIRFDLCSAENADEKTRRVSEEALLMKWLRQELTKEKCELDVLVKWYEGDKARLELDMADLKVRNESFECERNFYRRKYESTLKDLEDVGRELTFYKQESSTILLEEVDKSGPAIRRFHSESLLYAPSVMAKKRSFKDKLRKTTKDLFGLERKFTAMEKERREVAQELDMLRGEFIMFQIQQQCSKGDLLSLASSVQNVPGNVNLDDGLHLQVPMGLDTSDDDLRKIKIPKKDFELMKKQLHHAEQAAARLDTEAAHWQNEISKLKDSMKRTACGKSENVEKLRNQISSLNSKLISTKKAKDKMILECRSHMSELTNQLIRAEYNAETLENEVSRYGEQCLDLKKQLHTTAGKQQEIIHMQQKEVEQLKTLVDDLRSKNKQLENEVKELGDKSEALALIDEHEASETETVVDLLQRLHEKTNQTDKMFKEIEEIRTGYQSELAELKAQLDHQQQKIMSSVEGIGSTNFSVDSLQYESSSVVDDLRKKFDSERAKTITLTEELELLRQKFDEERAMYENETDNLRQRLLGAALSIETAEKSMNVENALETVELLHSKLAVLTAEMEQREGKHQEMYALMFQKGQLSARAEFFSAGLDTASSSSTEWIFEKGTEWIFEKGSTSVPSPSQQPSPSISAASAATPPPPPTPSAGGNGARLNDEEVRLRFLRDSVYYFLMGRDTRDHLQAIMSILKFSERQRSDILQAKSLA